MLEGNLNRRIAALPLDVDRLGIERLFVFVEVFDELADAAFVVECAVMPAALVNEVDADALVQKRHLTQALLEHLVFECARLKDAVRVLRAFDIRQEADVCAGLVRLPTMRRS